MSADPDDPRPTAPSAGRVLVSATSMLGVAWMKKEPSGCTIDSHGSMIRPAKRPVDGSFSPTGRKLG
jgi:hypothetical protein